MSGVFRTDGYDHPLSVNGSSRLSWESIGRSCDESPAVSGHTLGAGGIRIIWLDGSEETFGEPLDALDAIRSMEF